MPDSVSACATEIAEPAKLIDDIPVDKEQYDQHEDAKADECPWFASFSVLHARIETLAQEEGDRDQRNAETGDRNCQFNPMRGPLGMLMILGKRNSSHR